MHKLEPDLFDCPCMLGAETENLQIHVVSVYAARSTLMFIDKGTYGHGIFAFMDSKPQYFFLRRCVPTQAVAPSFTTFLDHTQRRTTPGRTPLDEWSARRIDLYLTTHNTHNRLTSMFRWDLNPLSQQTIVSNGMATGTGLNLKYLVK